MRILLFLRASILAVLLVGWMAAPALAAPTVLSSDPEAGEEMHEPPAEVTIEFSEPLEPSSGMTVEDECGNRVSKGDAKIGGTAMNELNVAIGKAPHHGTYTVEYVATGVTGTANGSYTFVVHGGTGCDGSGDGDGQGGDGQAGGGHGGHGGNNGGGHDGGQGGDQGGGGSGGQHSGGHDGTTQSSSGNQDGMDMSNHGEHQDMKHSDDQRGGMDHKRKHPGKDHKGDKHGPRHNDDQSAGGPIAAPGDIATATDIPTGTTVLVALGLAVLMGSIGGWVLRVSGPS